MEPRSWYIRTLTIEQFMATAYVSAVVRIGLTGSGSLGVLPAEFKAKPRNQTVCASIIDSVFYFMCKIIY